MTLSDEAQNLIVTKTEANVLKTEIWVPVYSPALPFSNRSLVYLNGRMIAPEINSNEESEFIFYIEAIYVRVQKILRMAPCTFVASPVHRQPEPSVVAKILECSIDASNTLTALLEAKENVGNAVEIFHLG